MKKVYIMLLLVLILFTGCNKKENTSKITTNSPVKATSERIDENKTSEEKEDNVKSTKNRYAVTVNGKGYNIGDTLIFTITYKTKQYIAKSDLYIEVLKKCSETKDNFSYLADDLEVNLIHNLLEPVKEDPDQVINKVGYCGHGYQSVKVTKGYNDGANLEKIDFSKGRVVLTFKVKIKRLGDYRITFKADSFKNVDLEDISDVQVLVSQRKNKIY